MKCKGIVALSKGDPQWCDVPVTPPGPGEIQVRMAATLVSTGTERAWVNGLPNAIPEYPYIPGYCCAGWVEKTGIRTTGFQEGDRVACYAVGVGHREIGNVPDYRVVKIPDGVSFSEAAFTSLGQTSLQGVRKCGIELGETVVSLGLGIVGILALALARLNGAVSAVGIDRQESRLFTALQCGADEVLWNEGKDWEEHYWSLTDGRGAEVVIENTGVPAVMAQACRIAADYGRVCILGCPRGSTSFDFYQLVQKKSITVLGAHAVDSIPTVQSYPRHWTFSDDAACFLKFLKKGALTVGPLIGEEVSKENAISAYKGLMNQEREVLGMIIHWE
ncbi:zinc-binding alcohol dehydrogenase [Diplocloster hominis]|uniref:zinc-dependent alcohol dehydrogenase n=1 Tax=Diplocloster hominis TaxID=3079010 RepID=UPI0031BBC0C8